MPSPNVALPTTQQNNFNVIANNGNGNGNGNGNNSAQNTPAVVVTQSENAVQATSSSETSNQVATNGASTTVTKSLQQKESQSKVESSDKDTRASSRARRMEARQARLSANRIARAAKHSKLNKVVDTKKAAKMNGNEGVSSAASNFTKALKSLEAKGKIDLKGQDVEAFSKRLTDLFSRRGVNVRRMAKMVSTMLSSSRGNSFANKIEKDANKQTETRDTEKSENTNDTLAPKNAVSGVVTDSVQAVSKDSVTTATQPQAPTPLSGGFDGSSLGVLQQAPQTGADNTSVRAKAEADAKAAEKSERPTVTEAKQDTMSVRAKAEADAKAAEKTERPADTNAKEDTTSVRAQADADAKAVEKGIKETFKASKEAAKETFKASEEAAKEAFKAAEEAAKGMGDEDAAEEAIETAKAAQEAAIEDAKEVKEAAKEAAKDNGVNGTNLAGNGNVENEDDDIFALAVRLLSAANERANENANAALGAQNRGGLSGANMIALQASGGMDVEASNFAETRDQGSGEAEELAARLAEANSRLDAQSDSAEVEEVVVENVPASTRMAEITNAIMEQADVAADTDTQKVELNESLMNALNEVREKADSSDDKKEDKQDGVASIAA
ncbi:MAG: hypothetical protein QF894_15315 [Alphaproteobacteria bacterium]|nr:hypothetical protein [Alphaproteobacteria bacterium]